MTPSDLIETLEWRNAPPKTLAIGNTVRFEIGGLEGICTLNFPADNGAFCALNYESERKSFVRAKLYIGGGIALNDFMSPGELVIIALGGLLLVVAGIRLARNFFSADAKWERRRRRSNSPISAKSNRPTVRFSVRTKKPRRK